MFKTLTTDLISALLKKCHKSKMPRDVIFSINPDISFSHSDVVSLSDFSVPLIWCTKHGTLSALNVRRCFCASIMTADRAMHLYAQLFGLRPAKRVRKQRECRDLCRALCALHQMTPQCKHNDLHISTQTETRSVRQTQTHADIQLLVCHNVELLTRFYSF